MLNNMLFVVIHTEEISLPGIIFIAIIIVFIIRVNLGSRRTKTFKSGLYRRSALSDSQTAILDRYCYYYYNMPTEDLKQIFRKKVAYFINVKKFIPAGGLKTITEEMKVLISASATQLAFGYPRVFFMHFNSIVVFPEEFRLHDSNELLDGKVNLKGAIFLSWKSFVLGYKVPDDGRNLGLHELAHALYFENAYPNDEYDFINRRAMFRFVIHTKNEMVKISEGQHSIFREYAFKNRHEFFAVAVEYFFERPFEMKEYNEDLYNSLALILNQDTADNKYSLRVISE